MDENQVDRLFVAWRDSDRRARPVGLLTRSRGDEGTRYTFRYLEAARSVLGFSGIAGFPDFDQVYQSQWLFPTFSNRLMSDGRPDYEVWLSRLALERDPDVFEILASSGGLRMTDRIELFALPRRHGEMLFSRFMIRGIRYVEGAVGRVGRLERGQLLAVAPEPDNPVNPRALLLDTESGEAIGYIPDYLVDVVCDLQEANGRWPDVTIRRVSPDAPPPMMVLVDLTAPWPEGFRPFAGAEYRVVDGLATAV